jgi:hypothetical protein
MRRRVTKLVIACVAIGTILCGIAGAVTGEAQDPVAIGPGGSERPVSFSRPGPEPSWAAQLPDPTAPEPSATSLSTSLSTGARAATTSSTTQSSTSGLPARGTYDGTATIEVGYYSYCKTRDGNLAYAGSRTYRTDGQVIIGSRAQHDGVSERSPFNLVAGSALGVEAATQIVSGTVATDNDDDESIVVDYWDIEVDDGELEGTLVSRIAGLNLNSMQTMRPLGDPCSASSPAMAMNVAIAEGATLSGEFDTDSMELELVGQTIDKERRFRITFDVER